MSSLDLRAYCDESYAGVQATDIETTYAEQPYVIAGYIGPSKIWRKFESAWRRQLKLEQLPFFHMSDCEAGAGKLFKHLDLKTEEGRGERDRLQRVFIAIINRFEIYGVAAGVPQDQFAALHGELSRYRAPLPGQKQSMVTPYLFSMELCVNAMFARLMGRDDEDVTFIFDQQHEYEGRAHAVRASLKANELYRKRDRLGPLIYCDKKNAVPLQSADILAFETMRELRDPEVERWQRALLDRSRPVVRQYFTKEKLADFAARVHAAATTTG